MNTVLLVTGLVTLVGISVVGGFWCLGLRVGDSKIGRMSPRRRDGIIVGTGIPSAVTTVLLAIGLYATPPSPHNSAFAGAIILSVISFILLVISLISIGRLTKK